MVELSFGGWLRRQRKAAGLTQEQLAKQVNCSTITLRKIEAEERRPSAQIAGRLAEIFNISENERPAFIQFARGNLRSAFRGMIEDVPWHVPPVRSNLPASVTSLVGRDREIAEVREYLSRDDIRLVTLIGPPGIGKTRLSLEVARTSLSDFPDGAFFAALAPLDDPSPIPSTIIQALGYEEANSRSTTQQLTDRIGDKRILLVLDNCEHLIEDVAPFASRLLSACSHLKIIATSREAMRVPGEWLYPVSTLNSPKENSSLDLDAASKFTALTLFAERARAARPDFALTADNIQAVTSICAQLDGLPLAIELIASRIRFLSPQALLERMTGQFVLSADGMRVVSARQKTLNNAIGWSYNQLSPEEQKIFARLSIFAGGFTLEAAEAVLSGIVADRSFFETVTSLADKSLLQRSFQTDGSTRFNMLVTIQDFALERLRRMGEEENVRKLHLRYFVAFSEQAGRELVGPQQMEWRARVFEERDNLRAALEWAVRNDVESGMFLAGNLGSRFWENFSIHEGVRWLTEFLQKPESHHYPKARAKALCIQAYLQFHFQRFDLQRAAAEEALTLSRAIGDQQNECDSLNILGSAMQFLEGMEQKANLQGQALVLAGSMGDVWRQAESLSGLSWDKRDPQKALACREQSIALYRQVGDWQGLANGLSVLASDVVLSGNIEYAQTLLDEYTKLEQHTTDKRNMEFVLTTKARIAFLCGDYELARFHLLQSMANLQELGNRMGYLWARVRLGYVTLREGNAGAAKEIILDCIREFQKDETRAGLIFPLELLALFLVQADRPGRAARLIGWAEATRQSVGDFVSQLDASDWKHAIDFILAKLGENGFKAMREEGAAMTMTQVVAYAFDEQGE